ncbi:hypothetical protein GCM10009560_38400 [Nonomuraea longicatena]|uniref:Uncharacterized protein n=2 Tax=Nonomuraea longicatena TaxID=83682 RepID=A0ABP4A9X2_9ACTN
MRGDGGDVYWRRRMSVLVGVLVVVAVVAWACSSSSSGPEHSSNAKTVTSGSPSPDPLLAGLRTLAMGTGTPSPTPSPSASPAKPTPQQTRPRKPGALCEPADLVLNLQGRQDVYGAGSLPNLMATLVNTGPVMCTADVGARALEIRITSGEDRIWSTADCVAGEAASVQRLERGIPYVRSLDWDRKRSSATCGPARSAALPGTYVAVARLGKLKSPMVVFHLR